MRVPAELRSRIGGVTVWLLAAAPALAVRPPPAEPPVAADAWFHDDGAPRRVVRLGPPSDGRAPVRVELPDGRAYTAEIDAHALVEIDPGADASAVLARHGLAPVSRPSAALGYWRVRGLTATDADGLALADRLTRALSTAPDPALRGVMPDLLLGHTPAAIDIPPNDPRYPGQWFLARVAIEEAWRLSDGDPAVSIVIIDSGCAVDHPDLAADMDPGYDVVDDDDDPRPLIGFPADNHGTAVAGVAGAVTDNGVGIAGACPRCRLRCVRLLPEDGTPTPLSADVAAFDFAFEVGAQVVNNSWGFSQPVPVPGPLRRAISRLVVEGREGRGALVTFAAGNDSRVLNDDELPALPGVVGVGATNNFDELTQFSNSGRGVDVVAPTGTLTTDLPGPDGADPGDYTTLFGGTSSAAPLVAGVLGLMVAAAPQRTGEAIREALISTAQQSIFARPGPDGHDLEYGYGVIRPAAALRALLGVEPDEPDAGPPDAAAPDAEILDAAPPDAAEPDATREPPPLAPAAGDATPEASSGGGCNAAPSAPAPIPLALLALLIPLARPARRS